MPFKFCKEMFNAVTYLILSLLISNPLATSQIKPKPDEQNPFIKQRKDSLYQDEEKKTGALIERANKLEKVCKQHAYNGEYKEALSCYSESLEIYKKHGKTFDIVITLTNIGYIYGMLDKYDDALVHLDKAGKLRTSIELFLQMC
jgi:tetratricopeptide (TPR) repeat protein